MSSLPRKLNMIPVVALILAAVFLIGTGLPMYLYFKRSDKAE